MKSKKDLTITIEYHRIDRYSWYLGLLRGLLGFLGLRQGGSVSGDTSIYSEVWHGRRYKLIEVDEKGNIVN